MLKRPVPAPVAAAGHGEPLGLQPWPQRWEGPPHHVRGSSRLPFAHAAMPSCVLQGTEGLWAAAFASAMGGSPTMYSASEPAEGSWWANGDGRKWVGGRTPSTSINFVTAHDGFALADLVTYNEKHNEANGEDNRWAGLRLHVLDVWTYGRFTGPSDQGDPDDKKLVKAERRPAAPSDLQPEARSGQQGDP